MISETDGWGEKSSSKNLNNMISQNKSQVIFCTVNYVEYNVCNLLYTYSDTFTRIKLCQKMETTLYQKL